MKFAVVGAGAIGGYVGAILSRAEQEVTLIARGPHLKAMQEEGVRVRSAEGEFVAHPAATDDPARVGPVDAVLLALKAHSVTGMAPRLKPLIGDQTTVVSMQNGIPWWYFYKHGGEWEGTHLEMVDPGGVINNSIEPRRVVGCVIYCSTIIARPGYIEHIEGNRFAIGEPDGVRSERCRKIADAFISSGLKCPIRTNLRQDVWLKLMGNVAYNPLSALTRATLIEIVQCPETRKLAADIMSECEQIAGRLGIDLLVSIEQRLAGAEKVGHHKTSMLQDIEAGRPMELDSVVGAVVELGLRLGLQMPYTNSVYASAKLLGEVEAKARASSH